MPNPIDLTNLDFEGMRTELGAALLELDTLAAVIERQRKHIAELESGVDLVLSWYGSDKPNMRPVLIQGMNMLRSVKGRR